MILSVALLVLLLTHPGIAKTPTAENIANFAISGWWSDCTYFAEFNETCVAPYQELAGDPVSLDPTGNTCYVNPHADPSSSTSNVVFWLGPPGSEQISNGTNPDYIYLYMLNAVGNEMYLPTDCADSGACSCDSLEPLRGDWRTTGTCNTSCTVALPDTLQEEDCAVFVKTNQINKYGNDTIVTCAIQGSLVDMTPETPDTGEPDTSGSMKSSVFYWTVLTSLPAMLVVRLLGV